MRDGVHRSSSALHLADRQERWNMAFEAGGDAWVGDAMEWDTQHDASCSGCRYTTIVVGHDFFGVVT